MAGFPNRILRANLGPHYLDTRPVEDPEREFGSEYQNLLLHQAVGVSLISPIASLVAKWNSGTSAFSVYHQEEAWNIDHSQAHPTVDRTSTGVYTVQFAATYLDADGAAIATALSAARATASAATTDTAEAWVDSGDATLVHVRTFHGGSAADLRFWLEVI